MFHIPDGNGAGIIRPTRASLITDGADEQPETVTFLLERTADNFVRSAELHGGVASGSGPYVHIHIVSADFSSYRRKCVGRFRFRTIVIDIFGPSRLGNISTVAFVTVRHRHLLPQMPRTPFGQ